MESWGHISHATLQEMHEQNSALQDRDASVIGLTFRF